MAWDRRRYGQRERSSFGREPLGRPGGADEELAELEALLAGEGEPESVGAAWRSRVSTWGADAARRTRGRELLAAGAVHGLRVSVGRVVAEVIGSEVYTVQVVVRPPSRWEIDAMRRQLVAPTASRPGALMSDALLMLDALVRTMVVTCTCPDGWGCKHAVAVLQAFGPRLDAEPMTLMVLWGAAEAGPADAASEEAFVPAPLAANKVALTGDLAALFGVDLVDE